MRALIILLTLLILLTPATQAGVLDFLLLSLLETDARQTRQWAEADSNPLITPGNKHLYFEVVKGLLQDRPVGVKLLVIAIQGIVVITNDALIREWGDGEYYRTFAIEYRWTF